jgi:hypothetical protein
VFIEYRCHEHGVVGQADTMDDHERLEVCPTCEGPVFVVPGDGPGDTRH